MTKQNVSQQRQTTLDEVHNQAPKPKNHNVPELRFPEFTDEWQTVKLDNISDVTKLAGFEFTKYVQYDDHGTIIALRGLNIKNNSLDLTDVKYIDKSDFSKLKRSKLYKNDLLFTYVGTIGEVCLIEENNKYYLAPNVCRIRPISDTINHIFLKYYFNTNEIKKEIKKYVTKSSQPSLSMENIRKFKIKLPSLNEQEKIVSFLSAVDYKISLMEKKHSLYKNIMQYFSYKFFWENKDELETKKLYDIVTIPERKTVKYPELEESLIVQLHCKGLKLNDKPIKVTKRGRPYYRRYKDEILVGRQNIHNGSFALVTPEFDGFICSNAITSLIPKENINVKYLLYHLEHVNYYKSLEIYMNGTGQKELSEKNLLKLPIQIHDLNTQNKIANLLETLKHNVKIFENKLISLNNYKKGLLQKMFC